MLPQENHLNRFQKIFWIYLTIVAAAVAGLVIYVLFFRGPGKGPSLQGDVKLEIIAPAESPSGSEVAYEILVKNFSNFQLISADLEVFYPQGFSYIDSAPDPPPGAGPGRRFSFRDLLPQQSQKVVIIGRLEGAVSEIKTVSAKLHYIPENFRSSFVSETLAQTVILVPDLALRLEAPPHLVSGQTLIYKISVTNIASSPFSNVSVVVNYPEKFEFQRALPSLALGKSNEWLVEDLKVGETKTIQVVGKSKETAGRESFVQVELYLQAATGERLSAGRSFAFTKIRPSPLLVTHKVLPPHNILPGQNLSYEVEYAHVGETGLNNVVLSVVFSPYGRSPERGELFAFDFLKLSAPDGQFQSTATSGPTLIWIPATNPELLVISPGEKGKFTFSIPVSNKFLTELAKNPKLLSRTEYSARELPEPIPQDQLEFKIDTELNLKAEASVVAGPHPPLPGQSTTYEILLSASNSVNDVRSAELNAVLPRADVVFVEDSITPLEEKENLNFVPYAGTLRWQAGKIFALSGYFHESRRISFKLIVNPTDSQISSLPLLKDVQIFGIDDFTGKKITSNKIDTLSK